jgi:hypothetical protein
MKKRDFTLEVYQDLLHSFLKNDYKFFTFSEYLSSNDKGNQKIVILRHDVDRKPANALKIAQMENELGIKASYYFRIVKKSYNENIIKEIVNLRHEIGYHYEDLSLAKGDFEKAIKTFKTNLDNLRKLYPIKTICMHGSPLSKLDNKEIWKKINYHDYGIDGESYYDLDFNKILSLTDTGRRWNGNRFSVRDKVDQDYHFNFHTTYDILESISALPNKILINTHPQRWNNNHLMWSYELISQNIKDIIKKFIVNS